jgi:hypothetical protein
VPLSQLPQPPPSAMTSWFSRSGIHAIERRSLPEFFHGGAESKTPEVVVTRFLVLQAFCSFSCASQTCEGKGASLTCALHEAKMWLSERVPVVSSARMLSPFLLHF